jgi:hypothetical protein
MLPYPRPANWRFYVVCNESAWQNAMDRFNRGSIAARVYGVTFLPERVTILRGDKLADGGPMDPTAAHVIAHELAHIALNTEDESRAEQTARQWMAAQGVGDPVLIR